MLHFRFSLFPSELVSFLRSVLTPALNPASFCAWLCLLSSPSSFLFFSPLEEQAEKGKESGGMQNGPRTELEGSQSPPQPNNRPDFESWGFQGWPARWAVQELSGGWDLSQLRTMWTHEPLGAPASRPACDQPLIRGHTSQASSWGGFPGWAG